MKPFYKTNGLVVWNAREIELRAAMTRRFAAGIEHILRDTNRAWLFEQIEAPTLTPRPHINPNYGDDDLWTQNDTGLVLRPETTMGSYEHARTLLAGGRKLLPLCVWQAGKSYRKEQDKSLSNMRLKEFYQQEFQCLFSAESKADYQAMVMAPLSQLIAAEISSHTRIVPSERLPSYSLKTLDVEAKCGGHWMEVCSVSLRTDFSAEVMALEIAIGLDRCVWLRIIGE